MCVKTILGTVLSVATNIALGLWGIVMLVVGGMLLAAPNTLLSHIELEIVQSQLKLDYLMDAKVAFASHASILILLGLITIALSIFGFCCGQCGNICRLVYVIGLTALVAAVFLLLLIFITPVGSSVVKDDVSKAMKNKFKKYLENPEKADQGSIVVPDDNVSKSWFEFQSSQQCCGVEDMLKDIAINNVPMSCCQLKDQSTIPTSTGQYSDLQKCKTSMKEYINIKGCSQMMMNQVLYGVQFSQIAMLVSLLLMVLSLVFASFLLGG